MALRSMPLVQDATTPLDYHSLKDALKEECPMVQPQGRLILLAHIGLETGLRACHRYNLGNAKAGGGWHGDVCQFPCGEEVRLSEAEAQRRLHPELVTFIGKPYLRDGVMLQSVHLLPPHPWTSFRAYPDLRSGVAGYLEVLRLPRYSAAWCEMLEGDLAGYVAALKRGGYMTAGESAYLSGMRRCWHQARGTLLDRPTLRLGNADRASTGYWQEHVLGLPGADCDGVFGPGTERATRHWQEEAGLSGDGVVGPVSWSVALPTEEVDA